ncbi:MAG: hypothetical protein ABI647_15265 [Gemmatimonadota bacterium]
MRLTCGVIVLAMAVLAGVRPGALGAQEPRLAGRLPAAARVRVDSILDAARAAGLPTEPLIDRALEGAAKGAPAPLIVAAVARLRGELDVVRTAFGPATSPAELTAGASALRAGALGTDLARLRALRPGQPLTVAAGVLADLVAAGVPADTAIGAVLALATDAADADYVAFRRNVQRDIALGASPAAALGVRLQGDLATAEPGSQVGGTGGVRGPRKQKP